ncbi:MAG: choice-of-anchor tandem repeat GloVer-containing protein [Syntrophobacteraceae bacterium]
MRLNELLGWLGVIIFLAVFVDPSNGSVANHTILHNFTGLDGSTPADSLVSDGTSFYGMTQFGGPGFTTHAPNFGNGVIFKVGKSGSNFTVLHSFGDRTVANDGVYPTGSLILSGSTLYGMTSSTIDGSNNGIVFKVSTNGSNYTILHSFSDGSVANDGWNPKGSLVLSGSTLYGMTSGGGAAGNGAVLKVSTNGSNYAILHSFGDGSVQNDAAQPNGSLILSGSTLYGMTNQGGAVNGGAVFKISTNGSNCAILHSFGDGSIQNDGTFPMGSLVLSGSTLYGMSSGGGAAGNGVVFKISTNGSNCAILHSFGDGSVQNDGTTPYGSLILSGSTLYGMTSSGGDNDQGTIFAVSTVLPPVNFEETYYSGSYDGDDSGYFAGKILKNKITFLIVGSSSIIEGSAIINPDHTFSGTVQIGAGLHTVLSGQIDTNTDGSVQAAYGTWTTYFKTSAEYAGSWTASPISSDLASVGAGVWLGSWNARNYDPNYGVWVSEAGKVAFLTNDDYSVIGIALYNRGGYSYEIEFSGTWDPTTGAVQAEDDAGYGVLAEGLIVKKSIEGNLYQPDYTAKVIGKLSAGKL